MFVIDTDHLIIAQERREPFCSRFRERLAEVDPSAVFLTVISSHEQMLGANAYISRAKKREEVIRGYRMIDAAMAAYRRFRILPFDEPCAIEFERLRKEKVRIGAMDLRIASIALSHGFTVLTRNRVDFEKVPGLRVADWTLE